MSGTSLDGIDVAALATDGELSVITGPAETFPYPSGFRERLRGVLGGTGPQQEIAAVEAELTRLGLRKNHLELAASDPAVLANFVELRRITSELADVGAALDAAEEAWLETEERAP